jgi:hypothetical protein
MAKTNYLQIFLHEKIDSYLLQTDVFKKETEHKIFYRKHNL